MQIVILAGGRGTRLQPLTNKIPKAMLPILNKPFLQYQIEWLVENNIENIVLCVSHLAHKIKEYFKEGKKFGISIQYSHDGDTLLGTAGALKKAMSLLENQFGVLNGDSYLPINIDRPIRFFSHLDALGLMCVYKNVNHFDRSNVIIKNGYVINYDRERRWPGMDWIDYGLTFLKKEVLTPIPNNTFLNLDLVYHNLSKKRKLAAFPVENRFYEIGSLKGLKEFKNYIIKRKCNQI